MQRRTLALCLQFGSRYAAARVSFWMPAGRRRHCQRNEAATYTATLAWLDFAGHGPEVDHLREFLTALALIELQFGAGVAAETERYNAESVNARTPRELWDYATFHAFTATVAAKEAAR